MLDLANLNIRMRFEPFVSDESKDYEGKSLRLVEK